MARETKVDRNYLEALRTEFGGKFHDRRGEIDALIAARTGKRRYTRPTTAVGVYVAHHIGPGVDYGGWSIVDAWRFALDSAPWYDSAGRLRRGWDTGNYAAGIDPDGGIHVAALPSHLTYHVGARWNRSAFGCVILHDCRSGQARGGPPTAAELDALYRWFLVCDRTIGFRPWRGHQELKATACPALVQPHVIRMRGGRYGAAGQPPAHYP